MIKIDEENQVIHYDNEPDVDRNLFPNIKDDYSADISNILKKLSRIYPATNSGYISNSGAIQTATDDAEVYTDEFPVTPGNKITVSLKYTQDRSMWLAYCLYDARHTFISRTMLVNSVTQSYASSQFTIPDGAQYCRLTYRSFNDATLTVDTTGQRLSDIQLAGRSIVVNGVGYIPLATTNQVGVIKVGPSATGLEGDGGNYLKISPATSSQIKAGNEQRKPIVPNIQNASTFYGLAKASGDTTQAESNNAVGNYTNEAKRKILAMLGAEPEEYELIADITTNTALSEIEISKDTAQNSYKLKKMIVVGNIKAPTTGNADSYNASYKVRINGESADDYISSPAMRYATGTSELFFKCEAKANKNAPVRIETVFANGKSTSANITSMAKDNIVDYITAFRLGKGSSAYSNIPVGSTFKIYGIRYPE